MEVVYEIVHVIEGGARITIDTVRSPELISEVVETSRYEGSWIAEDRKILKYGRGEIHIVKKQIEMKVIGYNLLSNGKKKLYELTVRHGGALKTICLNEEAFAGYDINSKLLWSTLSLTELAEIVGKDVAYQCSVHQERYLRQFNIKGAI